MLYSKMSKLIKFIRIVGEHRGINPHEAVLGSVDIHVPTGYSATNIVAIIGTGNNSSFVRVWGISSDGKFTYTIVNISDSATQIEPIFHIMCIKSFAI